MVVGARSKGSRTSWHRDLANFIYNWLASYVTKFKVEDLTSGFRLVKNEQGQQVYLPAAQYLFLSFNHHHGISEKRSEYKIRSDSDPGTARQKQDKTLPGRDPFFSHNYQNCHPFFALSYVSPGQFHVFYNRLGLLCFYIYNTESFYQYVDAAFI